MVVDRLTIRARLPGGRRELKRGERGRHRDARVGLEHGVDVVVEREHERLGVDGVEPERLALEEEQDHVGQRARAKAAADGEVHHVAEPPALPLVVVKVGGHRREPIVGAAAAAAGGADEELAARAGHVDEAPVRPDDQVAPAVGHQPGRCTSATPISASRVMWRASASSSRRSAPAGRMGSTM